MTTYDDTGPDYDLRAIAADWHGGQWSPLYAFSSTGTVIDGATREAEECLRAVSPSDYDERARLEALAAYLAEHEPTDDDD